MDLVCARSTGHFEMTKFAESRQSLGRFIEFKFCESDFYFLNGSKNCTVATCNFGSVYDTDSLVKEVSELRIYYEC